MEKDKKQAIILSLVAVITLIVVVIGATYAYFKAQNGSSSQSDVNVTTYTTDVLTFSVGEAINMNITQSDFKKDMGNKSASTYAKAMLTANNKTNEATVYYNIYLDIVTNNFVHSQSDETGELILKITDPEGNELKSIDGPNYKEVTDGKGNKVSGFDITTQTELVTIASNYAITATPKKEDTWNVKLTFVNLDKDQSKNAGKSFSALLKIQKNEDGNKALLADYIKSLYTGTQGENSIYYHDTSLANGAGDNSYRYAGANPNNYVCFGSSASPCPTDNLYRIIGVFGDKVKLIKSDYATSTLLSADGDYSQAYTAPGYDSSNYKGELTTINTYYWNKSTYSNTWSESNLNKVNLNTNFINNIRSEWAAKIAETTWKVGGNTYDNIANVTPSVAYQNEIVSPVTTNTTDGATEYSAKIGLMYASDYGFAAAQSAWTTNLYDYDGEAIKNVNWMYMGLVEWTISRTADTSDYAFFVYDGGRVSNDYARVSSTDYVVRPSFNLSSSITYVSGSGSANDPIVIN